MSEDEKRAIQGQVLLEVEEAKASIALLRARAVHWRQLQEKVTHLLSRMTRESAHLESAAAEVRAEIEKDLTAFTAVTTIESVLSLDTELKNAVERLKKAETAKRSLGFV
ncbi:MAG: hypothetical protein ABSD67_22805 [Terracidiphilus sp.]|jgi:hypothetical protein